HCLCQQSEAALRAVLRAANANGAIFGDHPQWDRDGRSFIGFGADEFPLWELPANQEYVLHCGAYAKLGQFTAVIDSRTSPALYWEIYSEAESPDAGISSYNWWIENFAGWVPKLGWAYIPLTEDSPFAMFVARSGEQRLVQAVKSELVAQGIRAFELTVQGEVVLWPQSEEGQDS